eukprot:101259-Amphidinium_carterae.1
MLNSTSLNVDLKFIRDVVGRTHILLNMLDTATRYSQLARLKERSASTVAKKTIASWVKPFGAPVLIKHDLGRESDGAARRPGQPAGGGAGGGPGPKGLLQFQSVKKQ